MSKREPPGISNLKLIKTTSKIYPLPHCSSVRLVLYFSTIDYRVE